MNSISVSVVIPCRNEVRNIESSVRSILSQQVDESFEVLVADGMSDDGTRTILERLATEDGRVRIVENPEKIVSTGLNAAIRASNGEIIVRMDAHTEYAGDYLQRCLEVLRRTGADNVGGPWRAVGVSFLQRAVALAFQSAFSSGGAGSHREKYEGVVDSVYLGCWRKDFLLRIGLFDEELVRNQDDELNLRLLRSGGRIWQSPAIQSWYQPRSSLIALFRQYAQYGYWKVRVIQKHRLPASWRHLVPGGFVATLLLLAFLAPFLNFAMVMLVMLLAAYAGANLLASLITCHNPNNWQYLPVMPLVFAAYHFGYGWGFLRGIVDFVLLRKGAAESFMALTRKN